MTHAEMFAMAGFLALLCGLAAVWFNRDEGGYA